ncbi:MAG: tryptophan 2,3-dioxygenase family protein [Armatimonadota bacterium]
MKDPVTYSNYVRVPELLALQATRSDPPQRDEVLFLVIQQVHELWFKQILLEIDAVVRNLVEGKALNALKSLKRIHTIQRVLGQQIDVLETLTPVDFVEFRRLLGSVNGFLSAQFVAIEAASGGGGAERWRERAGQPGWEELQARLAAPTMYEALLTFLWRQGRPVDATKIVAGGCRGADRPADAAVTDMFEGVYRTAGRGGPFYEAYLVLEHYVEYDELWLLWRTRHARMVERTVGGKAGVEGTDTPDALGASSSAKFFPELWEVRRQL